MWEAFEELAILFNLAKLVISLSLLPHDEMGMSVPPHGLVLRIKEDDP